MHDALSHVYDVALGPASVAHEIATGDGVEF